MISPENEHKRPKGEPIPGSAVGGDDPDFVIPTDSRPLVCAIPVLRGVLPQCRSAGSAEV